MTLMSPLVFSRRSSSRRVIVETDVDEYIAKYERRQSIKKRVMSVFHPFQHSRGHDSPTAHHEQQQQDKRFSLPNIPRDQAMDHPPCHDCSLSGSSTVSHDDADDDDSLAEIDVDDLRMKRNKKEPKRTTATNFSSTQGTVQMMVAMSMVYAIASRQSTAPTTTESEETCTEVEEAVTINHKDKLSQELLAAIVAHKRHEPAVILKPLSPQLASEIVNFSWTATSAATTAAEVEPFQEAEQEEEEEEEASPRQGSKSRNGVVSKMTPDNNNNLESLKEKCANLATITELLSKQLVESALNKKRESLLQRKESKRYMEMLCRMESQRRAEMASWQSDKKYLEEKLRYNTKETVPPSILNKSDSDSDDEKQKKKSSRKSRELVRPRRHSFMDTMVTPVEFCVQNSSTPKSASASNKRASFSMASTMILQNRLLPAMLSAVANGGAMSATTGASPKKAKPM